MVLKSSVFIIAEAGVNHNGDLETAKRLVDAAVVAGADAVKFQTFVPEEIVTGSAEKALYQKANVAGGRVTQLDMIRRYALSKEDFHTLWDCCERAGIMFLSTPFDYYSVDFLDQLGVPIYKIPSGELTNDRFLRYVATRGKPLIVSTGMTTLGEVEEALEVLQDAGACEITLLHCTSAYPTPYEEVNLRAMITLRQAFGLPVGYSDHTPGTEVAVAAAALGARVIEKHFTLSRNMEGPDHKASLEPGELAVMVRAIRNVEKALGDGRKRPSPVEQDVMRTARRSLVAACDIAEGEMITEEKLAVKRPGTGLPPKMWCLVVGRRARMDIPADTVLTWDMI